MPRMTVFSRDQHSGNLSRFLAHANGVSALAFVHDGHTLVSGGADGIVRFWDAESGSLRTYLRLNHLLSTYTLQEVGNVEVSCRVTAIVVSPDGRRMAVAVGRDVFILGTTGWTVRRQLGPHRHPVLGLAWVDNVRLATVCGDEVVRFWRGDRGKTPSVPFMEIAVTGEVRGRHRLIAATPNALNLVLGSADGMLLRDTVISHTTAISPSALDDGVSAMAMAPWNHQHGYLGDYRGRVMRFGVDGRIWWTRYYHSSAVSVVAPAGGLFLVATADNDGVVALWDDHPANAPPESPVLTLEGHVGSVDALAVSYNGLTVYSGGEDGTIRSWETRLPGEALPKPTPPASPDSHARGERTLDL